MWTVFPRSVFGRCSGSWVVVISGRTLPDSLTPSLPPRPVWTAEVTPKTLATLKTHYSQDWMDWGWSPWKRVEAKVAEAVVRMRAERRPRPKLGLGPQALRTRPWRRRNKGGAHPAQPHLPQETAPAKLHLEAASRRHETLLPHPTLRTQMWLDQPVANCPSFSRCRGLDPRHVSPGSRGASGL